MHLPRLNNASIIMEVVKIVQEHAAKGVLIDMRCHRFSTRSSTARWLSTRRMKGLTGRPEGVSCLK